MGARYRWSWNMTIIKMKLWVNRELLTSFFVVGRWCARLEFGPFFSILTTTKHNWDGEWDKVSGAVVRVPLSIQFLPLFTLSFYSLHIARTRQYPTWISLALNVYVENLYFPFYAFTQCSALLVSSGSKKSEFLWKGRGRHLRWWHHKLFNIFSRTTFLELFPLSFCTRRCFDAGNTIIRNHKFSEWSERPSMLMFDVWTMKKDRFRYAEVRRA